MRIAASDISTQDTSDDISMEMTNYMTMKCASSDTEPLAFWQQHSRRFPMLSKLAASVPVEAVFSTTGLILNDKRLVMSSSIECRSFMSIMHTCLILNRQKTMNMDDFFSVTLSLISSMWTWLFDGLILTCPTCSVLYLLSFVKSMLPDLV